MKETEKCYLLSKCQKHYLRAIDIALKNPYMCLEELGKARAIKEIIEKYIDCQPTKYYNAYMLIVKLENQCRRGIQ